MAQFLYRVGHAAYLHKWRFLAVWLLIIAGVGTAAATLSQPTTTSFSIPGLESIQTQEKIQEEFPNSDNGNPLEAPTGKLVIQAPEGQTLASGPAAASTEELLKSLQGLDFLTKKDTLVSPVIAAQGLEQQLTKAKAAQGVPEPQIKQDIAALSPLSKDGRTGIVDITFNADSPMDITSDQVSTFENTVREHSGDLKVGWSGNAFQTKSIGGISEIVGLAVAALVLIVTFGSFMAAGLPLLTAVCGVGTGIGLVYAATALTDNINDLTPTLASMIGLAVGIDYALFILSRFRSELIAHVGGEDLPPKELAEKIKKISVTDRAHLAGLAVGKAGSAVVFAGLTVLIALAALSIINIPFLTAMALAAAGTVAIAVIVALTLLPAIVGLFGTKVFSGRAPIVKAPDPENSTPTIGLKWVRIIRKHPALWLGATVIVLALLAIPASNLRLAMPNDGTMAKGTPNRTAYEMIDEGFGPGRNAPMVALLDYGNLQAQQKAEATAAALKTISTTPGVTNAQVIATNSTDPANPADLGTAAQILITPEYGATDPHASEVLSDLRDRKAEFTDTTGADYAITGTTPVYEDISQRLSDALIPYIAIVLGLAFILLMIVFRSLWVPLVAALGFALSVAATFGVTVALWQEGFAGIVNDPQPIISFLPIMLIGLVFGLAMDYQVFLVTRMREGWAHGKTAGNATANGFKHGARVVTAAALIMISVFSAFMLMDEQFIKVMGFALAIAVFFDAFVVRMTFIPAAMFLLGEHAWKIPSWLNKILPKVDVEGEQLNHLDGKDAEAEKADSTH